MSKRIKEEYESGKEYYQFHGKSLLYLSEEIVNHHKTEFIQWHHKNCIKGSSCFMNTELLNSG